MTKGCKCFKYDWKFGISVCYEVDSDNTHYRGFGERTIAEIGLQTFPKISQ